MEQYINRIINADCLDILKQLPDKCIDLVLTDPPYNIGQDGGKGWDNIKDYEFFIKKIFNEIKRVSKRQIIFFDYSYTKLFEELEEPKERFVWHREGGFSGNFIKKGYEPFYLYGENPINIPKIKNDYANKDKRLKEYKSVSNVWTIPNLVGKKNERIGHPTQKPLKLFERCIFMGSNENDLVLDCFSGSGTTAVACHNLKRRFICIEKDPEYAETAEKEHRLIDNQVDAIRCPFLAYDENGLAYCTIYEHRPNICRLFGKGGHPFLTCPNNPQVNVDNICR